MTDSTHQRKVQEIQTKQKKEEVKEMLKRKIRVMLIGILLAAVLVVLCAVAYKSKQRQTM